MRRSFIMSRGDRLILDTILKDLNPMQRNAVEHLTGPLLVLAGAGSGKTKVLTCRIANLLEQGVAPYRILAITFTNKAAAEMRERVDRLVGSAAKDIWLSTFHSFCARLLRYEIEALNGYNKNFVIYDASDSKTVVKQCLKDLNLDEKQYPPNQVQANISDAKNQMMLPDAFARTADNFHRQKIAEVYAMYQKVLRQNNALDFDDLLLLAVQLLQENNEVREKYQTRFQYILVDEYQDTNGAQYLLTKILAEKHRNLCVVGDADQSIYGWRGANLGNILEFERFFPGAKTIRLEQNYRSTNTILKAANALSAKNALPAGLLAITAKIPYLTWSDKWGNGRGQTWAFSIRMYRDMDIWHKLFGVGPDGYFAFQKLQPGEYEVFTASDDITTEIPDFVFQTVNVEEAGQIYEIEEQFEVIINV